MFKPNWEAIAQEKGLGRTELRILVFASVKVLGKDNILPYSQRALGEALGVAPSVISRAVRKLVKGGLIFQSGHQYRLNSRLTAEQRDIRAVVKLRQQELGEFLELEVQEAELRRRTLERDAQQAEEEVPQSAHSPARRDSPRTRKSSRASANKRQEPALSADATRDGVPQACPLCGTTVALYKDAEGRWGCLACDQWVGTVGGGGTQP